MKVLISEKLSPHKYKTPEGYLICVDAILARTGKQTYRRNELFTDGDDSEVEVDRKPEEVFAKETLASFENKPVTVEHPDEDVNSGNIKDYAVGFVRDVHKGVVDGQDVILGTLVIQDEQTIEEIENGEHTELSCGYDCDIIDEENPQQKHIRGNHVALCESGRAGNARIVDAAIKDVYYTIGGYAGKYDPVAMSDIKHVSKYGVNAYVEKTNDGWQLILRGTAKNVKNAVENYFNLDASGISDSKMKDAYYNIGGYSSKNDRMLQQDISNAKSYGLKTYIEKVDESYQLTVEGPKSKVLKIVKEYFDGDVSTIVDSKMKDSREINALQLKKGDVILDERNKPYKITSIYYEDEYVQFYADNLTENGNARFTFDNDEKVKLKDSIKDELYSLQELREMRVDNYRGTDIYKIHGQYSTNPNTSNRRFNTLEQVKDYIDDYFFFKDSRMKDIEPRANESKEDFISRFMSETKEEYPDEKQRLAIAYSYWNKKSAKDEETPYQEVTKSLEKNINDAYLIQSKYNNENYLQEDNHFGMNKNFAQRFNSYEEAVKKANILYSDWNNHVNIIKDSKKFRDEQTISRWTKKLSNGTPIDSTIIKYNDKTYTFVSGIIKEDKDFNSLDEAEIYAKKLGYKIKDSISKIVKLINIIRR